MNKIKNNFRFACNSRIYPEEFYNKFIRDYKINELRDYQIKALKKQRIEKLLKINNYEN